MDSANKVLQDIGWGKNEAACYCALVEYGEMKASDIGTVVDLPSSKVYPAMQKLVNKGYARERDEDPKRYAAQNPRYVVRQERDDFNNQLGEIDQELQEAWEIQEESSPPSEDHAWILSGRGGMNTQLSRLVDMSDETLRGYDRRLPLTTPDTFDEFVERAEEGLDTQMVARENARDRLQRLSQAGAEVRVTPELENTTFYIADQEYVLLNVSGGKSTVMFQDQYFAGVMLDEFEQLYQDAGVIDNET